MVAAIQLLNLSERKIAYLRHIYFLLISEFYRLLLISVLVKISIGKFHRYTGYNAVSDLA